MNWVSVKDRLPDDKQKVLAINATHSREHYVVLYDANDKSFEHTIYAGSFLSYLYESDEYARIEVPTHWMPLPEPPTEEE